MATPKQSGSAQRAPKPGANAGGAVGELTRNTKPSALLRKFATGTAVPTSGALRAKGGSLADRVTALPKERAVPGMALPAARPALGVEPAAFKPSPQALALLRAQKVMAQDLRAAGGTFTTPEVEQLLGISRQAIARKVKAGALLALPGPRNLRRYPAAQFTAQGLLPGLHRALSALPSQNPWYRLNWLVNPDPRIGNRTPLDLLRTGNEEGAIAAARAQGQQDG